MSIFRCVSIIYHLKFQEAIKNDISPLRIIIISIKIVCTHRFRQTRVTWSNFTTRLMAVVGFTTFIQIAQAFRMFDMWYLFLVVLLLLLSFSFCYFFIIICLLFCCVLLLLLSHQPVVTSRKSSVFPNSLTRY